MEEDLGQLTLDDVPEHPSSSTEQCFNCSDINFEAYFGVEGSHDPIPSISVVDATRSKAICPFCNLLVQAAAQLTRPHRVIPRRDGRALAFYFERRYQAPVYSDSGAVIQRGGATMRVKLRPPPSPIPYDAATDFVLCPIFTNDDVHEAQDAARPVLEDRVDLSVCREWLRECEAVHHHLEPGGGGTHRAASESAAGLPADVRMIDVVEGCVVLAPPGCRYVALSYVWGQIKTFLLLRGNSASLEGPGALWEYREIMPKTIADAVQVTQQLGERYLWVDSLCIIQDSAHKNSQISSMDKIYGEAVVTLVAAQGSDASAGLTGIQPGSRVLRQIAREVWPDLLLTLSIDSPGHPAESVWASRGWTCQEQVISKRLLIFTRGQVIWQCPTCHLCEDTAAVNKVDPPGRLPQLPTLEPRMHGGPSIQPSSMLSAGPLIRPQIFTHYASIISDYTKRRFTFQDDILQAFAGLDSILQQSFNSPSLAGLPQAYFDQAMLWMPLQKQERREGTGEKRFPSWSWAGWIGQVRYDDLGPSSVEAVVPLVKWYAGSEAVHPINGTGIGTAEDSFGAPRSLNTFFWVPLFELLSGGPGAAPLPRVNLPPPTLPDQTLVHFWTSSAFLDVSLRDSPTVLDQFEASRDRPIKLHAYLPREYGRQLAGYLVLNGSGPFQTDARHHEVIVISEAQVSGFNPVNWSCKYSEVCRMYNVMLVEWDRDHRIAYRLGIGRVSKEAWIGARPTIKLITLG